MKQVILCVDDEGIVLNSLNEQLIKEFGDNLTIEICESGEEALEVFQDLLQENAEVPAVIADFIMPGMKGDQLLEEIHKVDPTVKNILLTGQASVEGVGNAVNNASLYRFISKPWDKNDLILTVKEAIISYNQEKTILNQNLELKELNLNLEKKVEQRTKELKELNATKDKFFSIIAHDLKNPFNTLLGFSELILMNLDEFDKEKIAEFIRIIEETTKASYSLLENLLEWSRAQTGRLKISPLKIDVYDLVKENVELLETNAVNKQIDLINSVSEMTLAYADANMINTVIRNLMSNAIKYTDKGGSVIVSSNEQDGFVHVTIADTGIGIKDEDITKLFRIDVNFSTKGTAEETGTGLGLILCKEFVQKNGGELWVNSNPGRGSEFTFSIPKETTG